MKAALAAIVIALSVGACTSTEPAPRTEREAMLAMLRSDATRPLAMDILRRRTGVSHDWDQFRDQYGNLVYRCRNVTFGEFDDDAWCAHQKMSDSRWPGPYL